MSPPPRPPERAEHENAVAAVRTELGEERFAAAWTEGRAMTVENALADALTVGENRTAGDVGMDTIPGIRVHALGALKVERGGVAIEQWGGKKAGTRQAQAIFAFLLDRGERGVSKDEFLEVIWPDIPVERADLGFHRTLGGLRRVLQADFGRSNSTAAITFGNDRYRLNPALIDWSDVGEFRELVSKAGRASGPAEARGALERARSLYRGDYLDDCPFYGDSLYVEERRTLLRGMFVEVLVSLGEMHEAGGDRLGAASCFREALLAADDGCRRAEVGLSRLDLAQEH